MQKKGRGHKIEVGRFMKTQRSNAFPLRKQSKWNFVKILEKNVFYHAQEFEKLWIQTRGIFLDFWKVDILKGTDVFHETLQEMRKKECEKSSLKPWRGTKNQMWKSIFRKRNNVFPLRKRQMLILFKICLFFHIYRDSKLWDFVSRNTYFLCFWTSKNWINLNGD